MTSKIKPNIAYFNGVNYEIYMITGKTTVNNTEVYVFNAIQVIHLSYDDIVSELINYKYTQDQITAITLNYLLTLHEEVLELEKVKEYQQDYKELQEYRAACKAEAKRAIEYVKEN